MKRVVNMIFSVLPSESVKERIPFCRFPSPESRIESSQKSPCESLFRNFVHPWVLKTQKMITYVLAALAVSAISVSAFSASGRVVTSARGQMMMEYIPDGMSKEQWRKIKKNEATANKGKDLAKVGITKFKSRSFESWQKSGGKNLFPVDPSTPLEETPYMQRPGGKADGSDLTAKGLVGRGLGAPIITKEVAKLDKKYDELEKKGKLNSSPFSVPWTAKAAETQARERSIERRKALGIPVKGEEPVKAKKSGFTFGAKKAAPMAEPVKKAAAKPKKASGFTFGKKKAPEPEPEPEPPKKKKGFFGF